MCNCNDGNSIKKRYFYTRSSVSALLFQLVFYVWRPKGQKAEGARRALNDLGRTKWRPTTPQEERSLKDFAYLCSLDMMKRAVRGKNVNRGLERRVQVLPLSRLRTAGQSLREVV